MKVIINLGPRMVILFSILSTTLLPFYVFILGVISINFGGIEQSITLAIITAVSAAITTLFQNARGLTFLGTPKKLIRTLFHMGFALSCLLIVGIVLHSNLPMELETMFAGIIYGIGCSSFNLLNRIAAKELSASRIAWYVFFVILLLGLTTSYSMAGSNFLIICFILTGCVLYLVSTFSFLLMYYKVPKSSHKHDESPNIRNSIIFGIVSSLRVNSLIILSMFYVSPNILPEITFALFLMRPVSLIFSVFSPLIYRFMDQTASIDTHKRKYFFVISLSYTFLACIAPSIDIFAVSDQLTENFVISIIIIFAQVNYGFTRNLIEYRCLQSNKQRALINGSLLAISILLICMILLIQAELDMFLLCSLLCSEFMYVSFLKKYFKDY